MSAPKFVAIVVAGVVLGLGAALAPDLVLVLVAAFGACVSIQKLGALPHYRVAAVALSMSFGIRLTFAYLQAADQVFGPTPDAALYESRGALLAHYGLDWALNEGIVPITHGGMVLLHAAVAWLPSGILGPGPTVALLSACASVAAIALGGRQLLAPSSQSLRQVRQTRMLLIVLSFMPGSLFWLSQNLKEGFVLLGCVCIALSFIRKGRTILLLVGAGIVILVRPYMGMLAAAIGVVLHVSGHRFRRLPMPPLVLTALGVASILVAMAIATVVVKVSPDDQYAASLRAGGQSVALTASQDSALLRVARGFYLPAPWDLPAGGLNAVLLVEGAIVFALTVAIVFALFRRRHHQSMVAQPAVLFGVATSLIGMGMYGLISANVGTLIRVRTPLYLLLFLTSGAMLGELRLSRSSCSRLQRASGGKRNIVRSA
jgi:hypothetical protein